MQGNLLYVNARIKSLENTLLTPLQLSRLAEADTLGEAYKLLQEFGYGAGLTIDDYRSYENIIVQKEREAVAFFRENLIEKTGLEAILLKNDYHNAKVLMKAKYLRLENVGDMLLSDGLFDSTKMKDEIFNDEYDKLPRPMAEALDAVDVAFANGNRSPRLIDVLIDKAMFADMSARIKKFGQAALIDYITLTVDAANISAFIRCRRLGLDEKYFSEGFIDGGKLALDFYISAFGLTSDGVQDKMKYTDYGELYQIAAAPDSGMVRFETAVDNLVNKLFRDNKYDVFSVAPIAGYYLGRLAEIKAVKLLMSALKNNLDKALVKLRLRELYA